MAVPLPRFDALERVSFVDRPNRFLVHCKRASGRIVDVFMPNPGRLRELLLPGATLYITKTAAEHRKTQFTAVAVERDGAPVFLHTHVNNAVAHHLLAGGRVPSLENATVTSAEVRVGRSRFDFEVTVGGRRKFVEVKSVTLFGRGVAMFPDAVTERGRRHLQELAELRRGTTKHVVLFLVHTPKARIFLPDYHTDLAFSRTFYHLRHDLDFIPLSIGWTPTLRLQKHVRRLDIPWGFLKRRLADRGAYIAITQAPAGRRKAFYIAVDETTQDLTAAMAQAKRQAMAGADAWAQIGPIDDVWESFPVRAGKPIAGDIAAAFAKEFEIVKWANGEEVPAFLFRSSRDPRSLARFQAILEQFRMDVPPLEPNPP